jgi:hypothetical protein
MMEEEELTQESAFLHKEFSTLFFTKVKCKNHSDRRPRTFRLIDSAFLCNECDQDVRIVKDARFSLENELDGREIFALE